MNKLDSCQGIGDKEREAYEKGLNDAWEFVIRLDSEISVEDLVKIFGADVYNVFDGAVGDILEAYNVTEALKKVQDYEDKKKSEEQKRNLCSKCMYTDIASCAASDPYIEWGKYSDSVIKCEFFASKEIKVGDELCNKHWHELKMVVTCVHNCNNKEYISGVCIAQGGTCNEVGDLFVEYNADRWEKTGKHYNEIKKLLTSQERR